MGRPGVTFSPDMRELLELFEAHQVRYALVGGFAVNYYGYVRATQDVDLLVAPTDDNAVRVMKALAEFGFAAAGIPEGCFARPGSVVHLGAESNRVDLLTNLKGVDADEVVAASRRARIGDLEVNVISFEHLIAAKRSSDRPRDQADADELLRTRRR